MLYNHVAGSNTWVSSDPSFKVISVILRYTASSALEDTNILGHVLFS